MKRRIVGCSIGFAAVVLTACSGGGPGEDPTATSGSALGGLLHDYARPDTRMCPSPACGGYWLVDPTFHSACHDEPSKLYVTGIYVGSQRVSPSCSQELVGFLRPDPRDPRYEIFELEL